MFRRSLVVLFIVLISNEEKELCSARAQNITTESPENRARGVNEIVTSPGNNSFQNTVLSGEIRLTKNAKRTRSATFSPYEDDYIIYDDFNYPNLQDQNTEEEGYMPITKAPWHVAMFKDNNFHCSGTLLTNLHVLTSAHCVAIEKRGGGYSLQPTFEYWLRLGSSSYESGGHIHYIKAFHVHPHFLKKPSIEMYKDLAIITLKEKVAFGPSIGPAVVHKKIKRVELNSWEGKSCSIDGWTLDNADLSFHISRPLKKSEVPIIINCEGKTYEEFNKVDLSVHVCTENTEWSEHSCLSDSGSGLFCDNKLVGVSSWGLGCAEGIPTIYARVDNEREFIEKYIRRNCEPRFLPCALLLTFLISFSIYYLL